MEESKKNLKISSTAYRVLMILYLLNKGKYSLEELITKLSEDVIVSRTFSKDVILKYITTLRFSGFPITRSFDPEGIHYQLEKPFYLIEFTDEELESLAKINNYINFLYRPKLLSSVNSCISKMTRYLTDDCEAKFEKYNNETEDEFIDSFKQFKDLIMVLEQYCIDKQTISITYSLSKDFVQEIIFEPEQIEYRNQNVYIYGLNPNINQTQSLQLDYITDIKQLPIRFRGINIDQPVYFRLTGKLAKSYRVYDKEEIEDIQVFPPAVFISNHSGDVDTLLYRLLKYGQFCEVISPPFVRRKMKDLIKDIINNYREAG